MINYIGIADIQHIVNHMGAGEFMARLARRIEADFARWNEFDKTARLASHSEHGVIELMPISDGRSYSFKYVNGHPCNTAAGLLTVTAFGVLAGVPTGYPLLLSELTVTTALRTAATSVMAARWLARPESKVMALIGNGAQSEFQAIAFHRLLGIREIRLYDVDPLATCKLERNLGSMPELGDLRLVRAASVAEAVRGADIVTTVTADKRKAVILTPPMIAPGMHLNAVGGDCPGKTELHPEILHAQDVRIVVEFEPQARIEGEIQQLDAVDELGAVRTVTELADVVRGKLPGRANEREVTIFDSVGFALNDFSSLRYLRRLNAEQDGGLRIDLIPELDDPKDLFTGLSPRATMRRRRVA